MRRAAVFVFAIACGGARTASLVNETTPAEPAPPDTTAFDGLCATLDEEREQRAKERESATPAAPDCDGLPADGPPCGHGHPDYNGDPSCTVLEVSIADVQPPWSKAGVHCSSSNDIYGPTDCSLVAALDGAVLDVDAYTSDIKGNPFAVLELRVADVLPGPPLELVARTTDGHAVIDQLVVCRAKPRGCSAPIALAGDGWSVRPRFEAGAVVLEPAVGRPPLEALGKRVLVFK